MAEYNNDGADQLVNASKKPDVVYLNNELQRSLLTTITSPRSAMRTTYVFAAGPGRLMTGRSIPRQCRTGNRYFRLRVHRMFAPDWWTQPVMS